LSKVLRGWVVLGVSDQGKLERCCDVLAETADDALLEAQKLHSGSQHTLDGAVVVTYNDYWNSETVS